MARCCLLAFAGGPPSGLGPGSLATAAVWHSLSSQAAGHKQPTGPGSRLLSGPGESRSSLACPGNGGSEYY
jgi:hypothetical protein